MHKCLPKTLCTALFQSIPLRLHHSQKQSFPPIPPHPSLSGTFVVISCVDILPPYYLPFRTTWLKDQSALHIFVYMFASSAVTLSAICKCKLFYLSGLSINNSGREVQPLAAFYDIVRLSPKRQVRKNIHSRVWTLGPTWSGGALSWFLYSPGLGDRGLTLWRLIRITFQAGYTLVPANLTSPQKGFSPGFPSPRKWTSQSPYFSHNFLAVFTVLKLWDLTLDQKSSIMWVEFIGSLHCFKTFFPRYSGFPL